LLSLIYFCHAIAIKGNLQIGNSIQSRIIAMAFTIAAEIERELNSKRTKEALMERKLAGKIFGKPKGMVVQTFGTTIWLLMHSDNRLKSYSYLK
jgi:DNA invertase Pin-like site-specific DNA recombinase